MRPKLLFLSVLLLGVSAVAAYQDQPESAATNEDLLMRPAWLNGAPLVSIDYAFATALSRTHIPGGAVILHGCEDRSKKVIPYRGQTLQDVLNNIVTADPEDRWEMKNGVVNLVPVSGVPDLLRLRIAQFDSGEATDLWTAGTELLALPEVRERADELGFSRGILGSGLGGVLLTPGAPPPPPRKLLNVQLQDVTLFEALNALVRANGHGEWIYHETHCQSENNFQVVFPD